MRKFPSLISENWLRTYCEDVFLGYIWVIQLFEHFSITESNQTAYVHTQFYKLELWSFWTDSMFFSYHSYTLSNLTLILCFKISFYHNHTSSDPESKVKNNTFLSEFFSGISPSKQHSRYANRTGRNEARRFSDRISSELLYRSRDSIPNGRGGLWITSSVLLQTGKYIFVAFVCSQAGLGLQFLGNLRHLIV